MNQLPDAVVASRPTATVGCYTVPDSDPVLVTFRVSSPLTRRESSGSGQEIPVLLAGRHGVDDHLVAALEEEDDGLEQAGLSVEAES